LKQQVKIQDLQFIFIKSESLYQTVVFMPQVLFQQLMIQYCLLLVTCFQ